MKDTLYLAALLEHIPQDTIQKTLQHLLGKGKNIASYLKLADSYACASGFEPRKDFDFVASPFEYLKREATTLKRDFKFQFQFQELNLSTSFFPKKNLSLNHQKRQELWDNFSSDFHNLQQEEKAKAETTLHLLHKYAVTLPNPSNIHPEVSFYDYAKIKAGLTVCLYDYLNEENKNRGVNYQIQNTEAPLLIIRADISGIQDFIGNIASKNASKNLKGRSFYVQLLVDTVLKLMLKKLELYEGNVMYASGGNFFVIAPNTETVKENFKEFEKDITAAIFEEHKTRIAVVMGYKAVTQAQIFNRYIDEKGNTCGIEKAITDLFEGVIDKKKKQKFKTIIKRKYSQFFEPSDVGGEQILDAITGEEVHPNKDGKYWVLESALPELKVKKTDDDVISEKTAKQIFIGSYLREADYWVVANKSLPFSEKKKTEIFPLPSYKEKLYHYLVKSSQLLNLNNFEDITIQSINNLELNHPYFVLYGGNDIPKFEVNFKEDVFNKKLNKTELKEWSEGDKKDFSHLALKFLKKDGDFEYDKDENPKVGRFKRLGVLKMDVDGLGGIFKNFVAYPNSIDDNRKGKRRSQLSFSYYAALSRNLDWYFKGYLNTIWATEKFETDKEDLKNYSQIIYSGGDDLFIIGRWDAITHFAKVIKDKFAEFTCSETLNDTEQVTISGGVAIVTDKFPVMKAADFAGEAEHKAKKHDLFDKEKLEIKYGKDNAVPQQLEDFIYRKNSFDLLGKSLHWEFEYKTVRKLKNQLVEVVGESKGKIPHSFLGKIQMHAASATQYRIDKRRYDKALQHLETYPPLVAPSPRWIWTTIYDFSQMANRLKHQKTLAEQVIDLQEEVQVSSKDFIKNLSKSIFTNRWNDQNVEKQSQYLFLELLGIAARWAELELRNRN